MTLTLPDEPSLARFSDGELRLDLACGLFAAGRVSRGVAARIAGVDRATFDEALFARHIPTYTSEMLDQDLAVVRELSPGVIVVTDTSVVLNLAWLRHEDLLARIHGSVLAPPEVRDEFMRLAEVDERFRGLAFPISVNIVAARFIPVELAGNESLDPGEVAALALAIEQGIRDILIDERAGREVARALGLRPSGLLGVLVEAKRRALIPAVLPLLDRLQTGARFRVSEDLRRRIAVLAAEPG